MLPSSFRFLTDEGIEYLREFLHLDAEMVPNTLKKAAPRPGPPGRPAEGERRGPPRGDRDGGRDGYRCVQRLSVPSSPSVIRSLHTSALCRCLACRCLPRDVHLTTWHDRCCCWRPGLARANSVGSDEVVALHARRSRLPKLGLYLIKLLCTASWCTQIDYDGPNADSLTVL